VLDLIKVIDDNLKCRRCWPMTAKSGALYRVISFGITWGFSARGFPGPTHKGAL
jgi:hypothetical protein